MTASPVIALADAAGHPSEVLGGKGHGLARLVAAGVRVPRGFVVTAGAFRAACPDGGGPLDGIDADTAIAELERIAAGCRERLLAAPVPDAVADAVRAAYRDLGAPSVAVRSSSVAEDAAEASFAGGHDSYLWVDGADAVLDAVRRCWASLHTARAVDYRRQRGIGHDAEMAVVVQEMVPARSSGVLMTLNPANGDRSKVVIEAVWGLGEPLVSGEAPADRLVIDKITGDVVTRSVAHKPTRRVRDAAAASGTADEPVPDELVDAPSLTDGESAELVRIGRALERGAGRAQDAEFAVDAGGIALLQTRPETVWSSRAAAPMLGATSAMDLVVSTLTAPARRQPE